MNNEKHTPTPWEVGTDEDGNVAVIKGCSFLTYVFPTDLGFEEGTPEANAAHIVKCVNMYDELVEVLQWISDNSMCEGAVFASREALKKAGAL